MLKNFVVVFLISFISTLGAIGAVVQINERMAADAAVDCRRMAAQAAQWEDQQVPRWCEKVPGFRE
jgi:hypothetical protein